MENYDSPEAVAKRANQEDPIVMYFVVCQDVNLNMSIGKCCAQVGHAASMLTSLYHQEEDSRQDHGFGTGVNSLSDAQFYLFQEWFKTSYRKVVLRGSLKIFKKLKENFKTPEMVIVIDNGLTELNSGTETVIGFIPMRKSDTPKIIKRLQVL